MDRLSLSELRARLGLIKRSEARLAAMKAEALAAYAGKGGDGLARRVALDELQASKQQARREVESASQLSKVPETLDALGSGDIPAAHAKQIAKAASEGPVDESVLVEAARREDFGTFTQTLRDHQHEMSGDDGKSLMAKQRERRTFSFFKAPDDGMFVLNGRFDPVAGNRIEAALADEVRCLRNEDKGGDQTTFDQRMADALENLVCADTSDRKPQGTTLILTADWDKLNQQLADARLLDGTPLPVSEALRLACDADILPCVFDSEGQELWVGRKYRSATEAQRAALIARDKHCIGCGRSAVWCEAHHIKEWQRAGRTDIDNFVLVCTSCHHNIHDDGWTVHRNPNGTYELRPPPHEPEPPGPGSGPSRRGNLLSGTSKRENINNANHRKKPAAARSKPARITKPAENAEPLSAGRHRGLSPGPDPFPDTGITSWQPEDAHQLLLN